MTITGGQLSSSSGAGLHISNSDVLLDRVAIVDNHVTTNNNGGGGVHVFGGSGSNLEIIDSVFAGNSSTGTDGRGGALLQGGNSTSTTFKGSIFADNETDQFADVYKTGTGTFSSLGDNLADIGYGGPTPFTHASDYNSTATGFEGPDYIVTAVDDSYASGDNDYDLSIRDAIELTNADANSDEVIWLPNWDYVLRRAGSPGSNDHDISFGDLEISDSLSIRAAGSSPDSRVVQLRKEYQDMDPVFDLLGDFNGDGISDENVDGADLIILQREYGSTNGMYAADADDDGDVDSSDSAIWNSSFGNTLEIDWA